MHFFIFPKIVVKDPLKYAMLAFTDDSSNGRTVYVVSNKNHVVLTDSSSAQAAKL